MAKTKTQAGGHPLTDAEMRERSGRTWDERSRIIVPDRFRNA